MISTWRGSIRRAGAGAAALLFFLALGVAQAAPIADGRAASPLTIQRDPVRARATALDDAHTPPRTTARGLYWIGFTDKGATDPAALAAAAAREVAALDPHTRARRSKVAAAPDFADLPPHPPHVAAVRARVARLRTQSRWFNAVSVEATPAQLAAVARLPLVALIEPVAVMRRPLPETPAPQPPADDAPPPPPAPRGSLLDYGTSLAQNEMINVLPLHAFGLTGGGVRIGVLDTGFQHGTHEALIPINVLMEHDFVRDDGVTENEDGDHPVQHAHGTQVLSLIGGRMNGRLYGPAFGAEFLLAKTEIIDEEVMAELDLFIAGYEYCEMNGADVITASLSYDTFDDETTIPFEDRDGLTVPASIAVGMAFDRGVCTFNAVGNAPALPPGVPNDAFNLVSVGQVNGTGMVTGSSAGPLVDGRIKPEVLAQGNGVQIAVAGTANQYTTFTSGTSYATPQVAAVAALLLEAHPEWTPARMRQALMETASDAATPTNGRGWGIIDGFASLQHEVAEEAAAGVVVR